MIEDKKLGLKMAENKEVALWHKTLTGTKARIEEYELALIVEREMVKVAARKLKEAERRARK